MNDRDAESGSRLFAGAGDEWPGTPDALVYQLDAVQELFARVQQGERLNLLDGLLDCVDWAEMFGSTESGFLRREQIDELKRHYRSRFEDLDPFYLAEQLSTELMTALMASGEMAFSDELKQLGRDYPALWREIRTFFSRKEVATALLMLAARPETR
ncbi:MAG: hypothetical protein WD628_05585 [Thermomicrobiales bacterium]